MYAVLTIHSAALRLLHDGAMRMRDLVLPALGAIGRQALLFGGAVFAAIAMGVYLGATFYAVRTDFALTDGYRRVVDLGAEIEHARVRVIEKESAVLSARADQLPAWERIRSAVYIRSDAIARVAPFEFSN